MKVIKSGNTKDVPWVETLTCEGSSSVRGCGAVLEVSLSDLFEVTEVGDRNYGCYEFRCPECRADTSVDLPPYARKQLRARAGRTKKAG